MDIFSHTLLGVSIGAATNAALVGTGVANSVGFDLDGSTKTTLLLCATIASLLPDLDYLPALWSPRLAWKYHRRTFHNIFAVIPLGLIAATITLVLTSGYGKSQSELVLILGVSVLAVALHLVLDLLTSFGTALFFPFSAKLYRLKIIYLYDPIFCFILLTGLFFSKPLPAILTCCGYLLVRLFFYHKASREMQLHFRNSSLPVKRSTAISCPLLPWHWLLIGETNGTYHIGYWTFGSGTTWQKTESGINQKHWQLAMSDPIVNAFLGVAYFPRIEVRMVDSIKYLILDDVQWWTNKKRRIMTLTAKCSAKNDRIVNVRETSKLARGPFAKPELLPLTTD